MIKIKYTTLLFLIGLLLTSGVSARWGGATEYEAETDGLETVVSRAEKRKLNKAFDLLNDGEFIKAKYKFHDLAKDNENIRPFWQSAMYLAYDHTDLCKSWWLDSVNLGLDNTLAQDEIGYLMPLNAQADCINKVAKALMRVKSPTPSQVKWLWERLPEVARHYIPAATTLAKAYRDGFGGHRDFSKSAQWFMAVLGADHQELSQYRREKTAVALSEVLSKHAREQQAVDPVSAQKLFAQSYAYAIWAYRDNLETARYLTVKATAALSEQDRRTIIKQLQQCQDEQITQCAFYATPKELGLEPVVPSQIPRDRLLQWLLEGKNEKAFESAKRNAQVNLPFGWAEQLYTSLLTEQNGEALFRLSYLSFQGSGLNNDLLASVAQQMDSAKSAKKVMLHAAAAALSIREVDQATATRAIDYLDRYVNAATAQELLYLSQVFSRPLTPSYDIDKAIHLAAKAYAKQPKLAAALQMDRLLGMKAEREREEERQAWRLIAIGLEVENLPGVFEAFDEKKASEAAKKLASQCQSAGLTRCDLSDSALSLYAEAWPASLELGWTEMADTDINDRLHQALGQYISVSDSVRMDALDKLMRLYGAPVFVAPMASDMQRTGDASILAMRYTLLAGALGKIGDWSQKVVSQAASLDWQANRTRIQYNVGDAYWRTAQDVLSGFPVVNKPLATLFYEKAVMTGPSIFARGFADVLRRGESLKQNNQKALALYEYALQQQRKLVLHDLPGYLVKMTDINNNRVKAYGYALMANQASFGPLMGDSEVEGYASGLSANEKAQAQQWADQCLDNDLYLCDIYEPNNSLLYLPRKE